MAGEVKRYETRFWSCDVAIVPPVPGQPMPAGTEGKASITIQNFPFLMKRVGHAIIGPNHVIDPDPGGQSIAGVAQDGQYRVQFRTDKRNWMNAPLAAVAAFGGGQFSTIIDFPAPIELNPKETISVQVFSDVVRQAGIVVQVVFTGLEPY